MLKLKRNYRYEKLHGHTKGTWLTQDGQWSIIRGGPRHKWYITALLVTSPNPTTVLEKDAASLRYHQKLAFLTSAGLSEFPFPSLRAAKEILTPFLEGINPVA